MRVKHYFKPILVALLILYASLTPSKNLDGFNFIPWDNFDKLVHFGMYFVLFLVLYKSIHLVDQKRITKILTLFLVVIYGLVMEILQKYVSIDRSYELYDMIANTLGAICGMLSSPLFYKVKWIYRLL